MTYRDDQVAAWQGHFSPLVLEKVTLGVIVTRFLSFEWASENGQFLVAYFSRRKTHQLGPNPTTIIN